MPRNHNIFFVTAPNGKGKSLFTVPGQMLTSRTALRDNFMTHGCESIRKKYPTGTVFYTDSSVVRFRKGCYFVPTLIPLMLPDGNPVNNDLFTGLVIDEYKQLTQKQTISNKLQKKRG